MIVLKAKFFAQHTLARRLRLVTRQSNDGGDCISVEDGKLVKLKLTLDQSGMPEGVKTYHGFVHEIKWKKLPKNIQDALVDGGLTDKHGKQLF